MSLHLTELLLTDLKLPGYVEAVGRMPWSSPADRTENLEENEIELSEARVAEDGNSSQPGAVGKWEELSQSSEPAMLPDSGVGWDEEDPIDDDDDDIEIQEVF